MYNIIKAVCDAFRGRQQEMIRMEVHVTDLTSREMIDFLKDRIDADAVLESINIRSEYVIPPYEQLNAEDQVMKSEEADIRFRLRETAKYLSSEAFMNLGERDALLLREQFFGMYIYFNALGSRMMHAGMLKVKAN